jgi:hypothetical protein
MPISPEPTLACRLPAPQFPINRFVSNLIRTLFKLILPGQPFFLLLARTFR